LINAAAAKEEEDAELANSAIQDGPLTFWQPMLSIFAGVALYLLD
jgi:hypothetical protein